MPRGCRAWSAAARRHSGIAEHYYFPGWHQPTSLFELMINMDRWNQLTDIQKAQIETVCGDY